MYKTELSNMDLDTLCVILEALIDEIRNDEQSGSLYHVSGRFIAHFNNLLKSLSISKLTLCIEFWDFYISTRSMYEVYGMEEDLPKWYLLVKNASDLIPKPDVGI